MIVSPEIETALPNTSSAAASEAVNFASSFREPAQPPLGFTKTYAEPDLAPPSLSPRAPTMTVFPEIETDPPKRTSVAPSEAVSLASCVQVVPLFTKIYAEPELDPASSSS